MALTGKWFVRLAVIAANIWLFERFSWLGLIPGALVAVVVLGLDWAALVRNDEDFEETRMRPDGRTEHQFRNAIFPIHASLRLTYADADGKETERDVVARLYEQDRGSIVGHCKLRNAERTFRIDRMKKVVNLETGEVLPLTRMRSWLRKHRL